LKITHIIRSLDPNAGGPPIVVARVAAEMARQGQDVRVIANASPDAQQRIAAMIGSIPGADQVKYEDAGDLKSQILNSQIVHLHGVWDPILKSAASAAYGLGVPYVVAPHGMLDPWSLSQKSWKKKIALALGYRAMLNRCSFLHLLNRDEKDLVAPLRLRCAMQVIPNGIAAEEFANLPPAGTFYAAHPELNGQPYILFLGRLHYKKGLDILADAFAIVSKTDPDVRLVIAGPDDGALADFQSRINTTNLAPRVHLIGPIFGSDKLAALADAACFALPSRQEGFSIAILEAMAAGKPVVISKACHFPDVAEESAGEVTELNAAAFAAGILKVLQNSTSYGQAGPAMVHSRFTWLKVVEQMLRAYQSALQRSN
jgi:glycosyltransferase involved in cell wall biosynthesis